MQGTISLTSLVPTGILNRTDTVLFMVRISRSVEYALVALQHMNSLTPDTLASARDISNQHDLPSGLVAKLLQKLASFGITRSEQGAHGGYVLSRGLDEITLFDVIEAVEGPQQFVACRSGDIEECDRASSCTVSDSVTVIGEHISDLFSSLTLAELLAADHSSRPGVSAAPVAE